MRRKVMVITVAIVWSLGMASFLDSLSHAATGPNFQKVLEGAKKEGKLVLWVSTPNREKTHRLLLEAFNKRFGLQTSWEWLSLTPPQSSTRIIAEASAGKVTPDVVGAGSGKQIMALAEAKLVKPYPWTEIFQSNLPGIRVPAEGVMKELRGIGLLWFANVYGIAWNSKMIADSEIPNRLENLLNPKWEGKFIVNVGGGGASLDTLSLVIGREKALSLAKKIADLKPIMKRGSPAATAALAIGEAPIAVSSFFNAERAAMNGEPVKFKFFEDYIPVAPLHLYVPEGSPNPNTARLFAAWATTEGVPIFEREEIGGRVNDPRSKVAKLIKEQARKAKIIIPQTLKDVDQQESVSREVDALFAGVQ